jgi:hypothetical protein
VHGLLKRPPLTMPMAKQMKEGDFVMGDRSPKKREKKKPTKEKSQKSIAPSAAKTVAPIVQPDEKKK